VKGQASDKLLHSYQDERLEAAQVNVQVTNRTARFLRPADGMERVLRSAAIALAKQQPHMRGLINTGRMAVANTYSRSPLSAPELAHAHSVQNVALSWTASGRRPAALNDLLQWAAGLPLLLVWGACTAKELAKLRRLKTPVRVVQVLRQGQFAQAREHVFDLQGRLASAVDGAGAQSRSATGLRWALLRPDSYLAARGHASPAWCKAAGQAAQVLSR
jgi:3-(3-hydroxy-phenyl)propionate hydroxylase